MRPKSKLELLELTHSERDSLVMKIASLTDEELVFPFAMDDWSVKDILQHLVDWEQRWINWYEAGKRGEKVDIPEAGYNWRQLNLLNEKYRQKHKDHSLGEVMADFHDSYQQILGMIEPIPEPEMLEMNAYEWTGKYPLIVYIAGNTCEHYRWANQVIRPLAIRRKMKLTAESGQS